jgi:hypothetical protein
VAYSIAHLFLELESLARRVADRPYSSRRRWACQSLVGDVVSPIQGWISHLRAGSAQVSGARLKSLGIEMWRKIGEGWM